MATEIRVPTLGESVTEATVGKWFKKVGDAIAADEPIVELETDKVTVEVPAPSAGTLSEITVNEGDTVGLGALLGQISAGGAAAAKPAAKEEPKQRPRAKPEAVAQAAGASGADTVKEAAKKTAAVAGDAGAVEERKMPPAPAAAKLLAEANLAVDQVTGSGKRGQVLKGDVLDAIAKGAPSQPVETPRVAEAPKAARAPSSGEDAVREERVRMTKLRQTIARRLKEAQSTAAMLTTFNEVDMKGIMDLRAKYKDVFEKKHGVKLGFMGFFTKAVTHALKEIPAVNAEIDGTDIIYKNYAHIGVAVGTDKGLVVPVVRDADADVDRRDREGDRPARASRARRQAVGRRHAGRHLHHLQRRRLRVADVDADPQRAAVRHPRHAQDPGPAGRGRRPGRHPPDDVSGAQLRPPHRRRQGGGDLPRARQGKPGGSGTAGARPLGTNASLRSQPVENLV